MHSILFTLSGQLLVPPGSVVRGSAVHLPGGASLTVTAALRAPADAKAPADTGAAQLMQDALSFEHGDDVAVDTSLTPGVTRYTFAVLLTGPSSDGDRGQYYLTSVTRPDHAVPHGVRRAEWATTQLTEELTAQGQHLGEDYMGVTLINTETVDPDEYHVTAPDGDTRAVSDLDEAREEIIDLAEREGDPILSFDESDDEDGSVLRGHTEGGQVYAVRPGAAPQASPAVTP